MKELRRKQIANYIAKQNSVTMTELVDTFQVSMNTIRSDISYLVRTGAVVKIYGAVFYEPGDTEYGKKESNRAKGCRADL
mgnify:CR=1 FL=1